jgi:signal transduction histidine kinase
LVQVLINLLGNAIKYSDDGPVVVGVHRNPAGTPDRLDVVDHGPGIAPGVRSEIFTPFWRGDDIDDALHGSGLGLAIAQTLCRDMGFDLVVASAEGRGSTFSVLLLEDAELPTHPGDCSHA